MSRGIDEVYRYPLFQATNSASTTIQFMLFVLERIEFLNTQKTLNFPRDRSTMIHENIALNLVVNDF